MKNKEYRNDEIRKISSKEKDAIDVASVVTHIRQDINIGNDSKYINVYEKNKVGSNRMESRNLLIPNYDSFNTSDYINVSINSDSHAGMAEWLTQFVDTERPSGSVGSIPTSSVINFAKNSILTLVSAQETAQTGLSIKTPVQFTAIDANNDSLIDYIEWIVPHLSNQTYQLIIEISKAEHLDENRTFIEDIYESVKAQEGNWSPVINNSHYVRVTFQQNLTSERDITVYARQSNRSVIINGVEIPYDIYLKKKRIDELRGMLG